MSQSIFLTHKLLTHELLKTQKIRRINSADFIIYKPKSVLLGSKQLG